MHELQKVFATAEGDDAWTQDMHALFGARAFDEAEALLAEALTALDSQLAWSCLEVPRDGVVLTGWEELAEAIALHEGDAITGVAMALAPAKPGDRAPGTGSAHRPRVVLGVYTDEAFAFSAAQHWELMDQCHTRQPAWAGKEEDIEVHMGIEGLDPLSARLNHHRKRHFLRVGGEDVAPLDYVEYVIGCWWRALRWHQAVAAQCALHGLPGPIPVVAGMLDLRPEVAAVHLAEPARTRPALRLVSGEGAGMAGSFGDGFIARRPVATPAVTAAEAPPVEGGVVNLRQRIGMAETAPPVPPRGGLWSRILRCCGRRRA